MTEAGAARLLRPWDGIAADLLDALVELSFTVQLLVGEIAERHDLSVAQLRLLAVLKDRRPRMIDLAGVMGLERSSITGLVNRAEKRGLVTRTAWDDDRRCVRVAVTAEGRSRAARAWRDLEQRLTALVDDLHMPGSAELLRALSDGLTCRP